MSKGRKKVSVAEVRAELLKARPYLRNGAHIIEMTDKRVLLFNGEPGEDGVKGVDYATSTLKAHLVFMAEHCAARRPSPSEDDADEGSSSNEMVRIEDSEPPVTVGPDQPGRTVYGANGEGTSMFDGVPTGVNPNPYESDSGEASAA